MEPNWGESYVILSQSRILYHKENGGTGLHVWTWINPGLKPDNQKPFYILSARRVEYRKSGPTKLLEGLGKGQNPGVGVLPEYQEGTGSHYCYCRAHVIIAA